MIDTHQHFWRLSRGGYNWMPKDVPVLYRDYEPADLREILDQTGIEQTIVVQADDNVAETEFLLEEASTHDWVVGVVGWVDLTAPEARQSVLRLANNPKLLGIRPMIQDIADPEWMLHPGLRDGLRAVIESDLTFDALVKPIHLPILDRFLEMYPELRVVVNHMAKPDFKSENFESWSEGLSRVGAHPNTFCKISGLLTEAPHGTNYADILGHLDVAKKAFGPDRLIFGSDWPVLNLAAEYAEWLQMVKTWCEQSKGLNWSQLSQNNVRNAYPRILNTTGD